MKTLILIAVGGDVRWAIQSIPFIPLSLSRCNKMPSRSHAPRTLHSSSSLEASRTRTPPALHSLPTSTPHCHRASRGHILATTLACRGCSCGSARWGGNTRSWRHYQPIRFGLPMPPTSSSPFTSLSTSLSTLTPSFNSLSSSSNSPSNSLSSSSTSSSA